MWNNILKRQTQEQRPEKWLWEEGGRWEKEKTGEVNKRYKACAMRWKAI